MVCDYGERCIPNLRGTHAMLAKFWKGFSSVCLEHYKMDLDHNSGFLMALDASRSTGECIYDPDLQTMVSFLDNLCHEQPTWSPPPPLPTLSDAKRSCVWEASAQTPVWSPPEKPAESYITPSEQPTPPPPWTWNVEVDVAATTPTNSSKWSWGNKTSWPGTCNFCTTQKEARDIFVENS